MVIQKTLAISFILFAVTASAGTVSIPGTIVNGADTTSGPTFTLTTDVAPTDLLTLTADGQVFMQPKNTFGTNAAGVVTTVGTSAIGDYLINPTDSNSFGALLLGNSLFGFHQVFPTNSANGVGSATPPNPLSVTGITLSSIGFVLPMKSGTVLQFLVSDYVPADNSGRFDVSGQIDTSPVPEPGTIGLLAAGLVGLGLMRRRKA